MLLPSLSTIDRISAGNAALAGATDTNNEAVLAKISPALTVKPVSYTHLDVYKRQVPSILNSKM